MSRPSAYSEAVRLHGNGQFFEAETLYREVLSQPSHPPNAVRCLAVLLETLGRSEEAVRLYENAIAKTPRVEFYVNLGALWISERRPDCAIAPLRKAIELSSDCVPAHVNLAGAYSMLENNAGALASFRKAFELEPRNAEVVKRLSAFLVNLDTARARKRAHPAMWTTTVTTLATTLAAPNRIVYEGRHIGLRSQVASPHPHPIRLPTGEGTCRIAFVSPLCVMDFTNGAATATRDALTLLQGIGFQCEVFCGSRAGAQRNAQIDKDLRPHGEPFIVRDAQIGPFQGRMVFTSHGSVPVTIVKTEPGNGPHACASGFDSPIAYASGCDARIPREEIAAFLTGCELFSDQMRPDVLWTYGGDPVARVVQQMARQRGIAVVFALHNLAYLDPAAFALADHVTVPSEFSRRHYRDTLGLECHVLPNVVDPQRVQCGAGCQPVKNAADWQSAPRYVTFVNPSPLKGVFLFARIAAELAQRLPDIPLLVVEGASKAGLLPKLGIDLSGLQNVRIMPSTPDPRTFYAVSKLLLMPSLIESAGLVAMEAMTNGIPVLASTRGALPETIGGSPHPGPLPEGEGGFLFDIPARYTPQTRDVPTAEEVAPWVEAIIRLWDDAAAYDRASRAARQRAQAWHPDRLAPIYRDFFSRIAHKPGTPLVAQEAIQCS